jgi:amino acid permease
VSDSILGGIGLSREDLLGGMPARRASTIVYAIENLTLALVTRSRHALARYQAAESGRDRERQFMDAVSAGREQQERPAVQDLERYATEWSSMAPDVPETKAQICFQLSTRYRLVYERTRRLRAALGVDGQAVADAYRRQQGKEIGTAFIPDRATDWRERLRWSRARISERLETMPPFWMAFSLTLTETVGGGMLALPIALAAVGVQFALVLLAVFAVVNLITIAALVEGITRDGTMRYGNGYFGQLVSNRLGSPGRVAIVAAMFVMDSIGLLVGMVGFGTMLASAVGFSQLLWVALLFVLALVVMRRENLNGTIAAALVIGTAILALAGGMIVLGLLHLDPRNLVPQALPAGPSVIALVFGVLLYVYFGHTSAGNAARQVLRRDPTGRTLLWGNLLAMGVAAVIYGLFVIAVNGSVPAARLAVEQGTAVVPLAEVAGPAVNVMGTIYVTLSLGIGSVFMALGLYLQSRETLGKRVAALSPSIRFAVAAALPVAIFVLAEILLYLGSVSFTEPLSVLGVLALPLLGGVFPMLILAAARRRGERVPGWRMRWLGSRTVVVAILALYLGAVVAHALFIWSDPLLRVLAASTAVAMAVLIVIAWRRGSFVPRTIVELRADDPPGAGAELSVVVAGRGASHEHIADLAAAHEIPVHLPPSRPDELYVWSHKPTRDGDTEPLPIQTEERSPDELVLRPAN